MPKTITDTDDNALLALFKDEDTREAAFTALVRKYQQKLYWHIRRMVVEHEDSNDILQHVFIKVWRNLEDFRGEANLYTWLYRIATNETLTWLEKEKKRRSLPLDTGENMLAEKLVAQTGFDAKKLEWKLQQAIQSLPEKQRIVFNLRYYDEMPYTEMAEILNTSEGALKASYHHAVKKVETFIKEN
ncbi:MAG: sigma-70 family RNA polymerase sigma factor [Chitinophagaceae bacterium]|nr:sigma-70 family RNA polymerase sigma factor [Chitinophagaceae bacterium]MCB9045568.1 sigma-70 family RNA polymerase sigma factor [Chitinophagales bacterium]